MMNKNNQMESGSVQVCSEWDCGSWLVGGDQVSQRPCLAEAMNATSGIGGHRPQLEYPPDDCHRNQESNGNNRKWI